VERGGREKDRLIPGGGGKKGGLAVDSKKGTRGATRLFGKKKEKKTSVCLLYLEGKKKQKKAIPDFSSREALGKGSADRGKGKGTPPPRTKRRSNYGGEGTGT